MMKKIIPVSFLSVLFFFLSVSSSAQPPRAEWLLNSGGSGNMDEYYFLAYPDGSVCQIGVFSSGDFTIGGNILNAGQGNSIYAARIDPGSNVLWVQQIISTTSMSILGYSLDGQDILHIAGRFSSGGIVNIGDSILTDTTSNNNNKLFEAQFGPDGTLLRLKTPLPFENSASYSLDIVKWDKQGNMIVSGAFQGDSLYVKDYALKGLPDLPTFYLLYYNLYDSLLWGAVNDTSNKYNQINALIFTINRATFDHQSGEITVAGSYEGDVSPVFGNDTFPGQAYFDRTLFLVHYDQQGNYSWSNTAYVGSENPIISELTATSDGGTYYTGSYSNIDITFDNITLSPTSIGSDYFIFRFNALGTAQWGIDIPAGINGQFKKQSFAGNAIESRFITDSADNFYIAGWFGANSVVFPVNADTIYKIPKHFNGDQFIAKFLSDGTFSWAQRITSDQGNPPAALLNDRGEIYLADLTNDSLFFGQDTLPVDINVNHDYIIGFDSTGKLIHKDTITCDINSLAHVSMMQATVTNSFYLLGDFYGTFFLDSKSLSGAYNSNLYLAKLSPNTYLEGNVRDTAGIAIYPGHVLLYKLNPPEESSLMDSTVLDDGGNYSFSNFMYGDYFLYAVPEASTYPNKTGTYYGNVTSREKADTLHITVDTLTNINITIQQDTIVNILEGTVLDTIGNPVSAGYVLLCQLNPPAAPAVIDSVLLDANGMYHFYDFVFDDYFLYAVADSAQYPNAKGTYYQHAATVADADTLHAAADTIRNTDIALIQLPDTIVEVLGGTVTDTGQAPVYPGYVLLYRLITSGMAPVQDSVELDNSGNYVFYNLAVGNYLLYAVADTSAYPNAIGTYYGNVASWIEADTIMATTDTINNYNIVVIEISNTLEGEGIISGTINYGEGTMKSTKEILGEPVKKVKVILIGVEKSADNIIAWVYTDDQGHYVFENVPIGNYRILVDIPGLPMDSTYTVKVSADSNNITNLDFVVTGTQVEVSSTTGVHQVAELLKINVYPNPARGRFTIVFPENEGGNITVFNNRGKVIRQITIKPLQKTIVLDMSDMPSGIYYLRLRQNNTLGVRKIIIQH